MRTILYECPSCGREHALCYLTGKGGKRLGVNCDDAALLGRTKFVPIPAAVLEVSDLGEQDLAGIPEYATAPARALAAGRENIGLPLMHTQPGRAVERSVDLPRKVEEDHGAAARLQLEIDQNVQARKELDAAIEALALKRAGVEASEMEARKHLREVQTIPLNFDIP